MQDGMHVSLTAISDARKHVQQEFHQYDDMWHNITYSNIGRI